ncbi:MAG: hypothetical protein EZS28_033537 [Streblomastix strix]|uniref:HECT-type E3 ubiquitin transferase n=1 Tax=Streblomastix strix TaxID=222440 RepID=A0A5J4UJQ1_9EUKA|nr:MAG: hypothetical protein EZS28_033537 [Streblomastix strix]
MPFHTYVTLSVLKEIVDIEGIIPIFSAFDIIHQSGVFVSKLPFSSNLAPECSVFYNEMIEEINLIRDYERYRSEGFSFLEHSYLFSVAMKAKILEIEARTSMFTEIRSEVSHSLMGPFGMFGPMFRMLRRGNSNNEQNNEGGSNSGSNSNINNNRGRQGITVNRAGYRGRGGLQGRGRGTGGSQSPMLNFLSSIMGMPITEIHQQQPRQQTQSSSSSSSTSSSSNQTNLHQQAERIRNQNELQFEFEVDDQEQEQEHDWEEGQGEPEEMMIPMFQRPVINFELYLRRDHIIEDLLIKLENTNENDLKKPLKVKFDNEEGVDEGGVTKEFFLLITRELFNPNYGMFTWGDGNEDDEYDDEYNKNNNNNNNKRTRNYSSNITAIKLTIIQTQAATIKTIKRTERFTTTCETALLSLVFPVIP